MYIKLISAQKTPIRKKKCDKKAYRRSKDSKQLSVSITPRQWGGLYWYAFCWIGRTLNNNEKNTWVRWNNMKKKKKHMSIVVWAHYLCHHPHQEKTKRKQTNKPRAWDLLILRKSGVVGTGEMFGGHHKLLSRLGFLCMVVASPLSVPIHVV